MHTSLHKRLEHTFGNIEEICEKSLLSVLQLCGERRREEKIFINILFIEYIICLAWILFFAMFLSPIRLRSEQKRKEKVGSLMPLNNPLDESRRCLKPQPSERGPLERVLSRFSGDACSSSQHAISATGPKKKGPSNGGTGLGGARVPGPRRSRLKPAWASFRGPLCCPKHSLNDLI